MKYDSGVCVICILLCFTQEVWKLCLCHLFDLMLHPGCSWVCVICLLLCCTHEVWQWSVCHLSTIMLYSRSVKIKCNLFDIILHPGNDTVECVSFVFSYAAPMKCDSWVCVICLLLSCTQEVWKLSFCHLFPLMLHPGNVTVGCVLFFFSYDAPMSVTVECVSFVFSYAAPMKFESWVCVICLLCYTQEVGQLNAFHLFPYMLLLKSVTTECV